MRAAFRKLATLTPLAWGFFVGSVYAQEVPWVVTHYGALKGYAKSPEEGCSAHIDAAISDWYSKVVPGSYQSYVTLSYSHARYDQGVYRCMVNAVHESGAANLSGVGLSVEPLPACPAGESKSLTWPVGRYLTLGDESSYQDFGSAPPGSACFSGCNASRSGFSGDPYYPDSGSGVVVQDLPYELDGTACSADTASPTVPDFPPAPDDGDDGDTGGGDTGGGDTGGGDDGSGTGDGGSGGGTGGGSGGSSGGGSGGGGDTGGGDTGGGDTGGDTGGGDTGGDAGGDTGAQDDLATSGDIRSLGDRVTGAISEAYDRLASAISGVRNDLQGMSEAIEELSGPEWGGDGGLDDGSGIGEMGGELGGVIAEGLNTATDDAIASRDGELQDALDGIAGQVEDWFGDKGSKIDPDNLLGFLPRETSCSDIPISVKLGKEDSNFVIPVCSLSSVKVILKWVFYALTIIGIWKILMNGMIVSARGGKGR